MIYDSDRPITVAHLTMPNILLVNGSKDSRSGKRPFDDFQIFTGRLGFSN